MPRLVTLVLLLAAFGDSYSQMQLKGYVVKQNGDTVSGKVVLNHVIKTPTVAWIVDQDGDSTQFYPSRVTELVIPGHSVYRAATVTLDQAPYRMDWETLDHWRDKSPEKRYTFEWRYLKVLVKGPVLTLLYLRDWRKRFFISDQDGIRELSYHPTCDESDAEVARLSVAYLKQLSEVFASKGIAFEYDKKWGYNKRDLMEIVRALNERFGQVKYDASVEAPIAYTQPYYLAAANWVKTRVPSPVTKGEGFLNDNGYSLMLGFGSPLKLPWLRRQVTLLPEFSVTCFSTSFSSLEWPNASFNRDKIGFVVNFSLATFLSINPWRVGRKLPMLAAGLETTMSLSGYRDAEDLTGANAEKDLVRQKRFLLTPVFRILQPINKGYLMTGCSLPKEIFYWKGIWSKTQMFYAGIAFTIDSD
ncbi:hypothetical protein [Chitinophaga rhizosphaerae]|uniref:hypothetical protein n=1 Tax=Chitinophaga rhizosphaerae TaxID=1864947 RepID=UPI000F80A044|nr:hypothetical protein [Chitinophaga rhizosphaerae]